MFDIRPTQADGSLDLEKIKKSRRIIVIAAEKIKRPEPKYQKRLAEIRTGLEIFEGRRPVERKKEPKHIETRRPNIVQLGQSVSERYLSISKIPEIPTVFSDRKPAKKEVPDTIEESIEAVLRPLESRKPKKKKRKRRKLGGYGGYLFAQELFSPQKMLLRSRFSFAATFALIVFSFLVPAAAYLERGLEAKKSVEKNSREVLAQFAEAKNHLTSGKFGEARVNFEESYELLSEARSDISKIGGGASAFLEFFPGASKVASANYVVLAGQNLALAGKNISESAKALENLENPLDRPSRTYFSICAAASRAPATSSPKLKTTLRKSILTIFPRR